MSEILGEQPNEYEEILRSDVLTAGGAALGLCNSGMCVGVSLEIDRTGKKTVVVHDTKIEANQKGWIVKRLDVETFEEATEDFKNSSEYDYEAAAAFKKVLGIDAANADGQDQFDKQELDDFFEAVRTDKFRDVLETQFDLALLATCQHNKALSLV